ncbi:hypothetical protein T484DRAFT_1878377 [Baffinella frigidus]|nr:hypothetical protein T484DRAFT_1878377 [Cryptophyta sp. CCMP2293]
MVSRGSVRRAPTSRVLLCAAVACALVPVLAAGEHDEANPHPREAYVTLVCPQSLTFERPRTVTSPEYVVGAEVLARCLRHFGTQRRMVALVGSTLQDAQVGRLSAAGFETTRVPDIKTLPVRALLDRPGFNATMNKLHVFGLFKDFDQTSIRSADHFNRATF